MTTITREERERVAVLLGLHQRSFATEELLEGRTATVNLDPEDIDRVAQALRDAEADGRLQGMQTAAPQWREVTETEPAIGERVLGWSSGVGQPFTAERCGGRDWWADSALSGGRVVDVSAPTRWMPLPPPPKPDHSERIAELEAEIARLKAEQ